MTPFRHGLTGLIVLAALAGCATGVPSVAGRPDAPDPAQGPCASEVAGALAYFRQLRAMPRPELQRELERRRAAYGADPSPANRMQLALLLALPGGPAEDEPSAIALFRSFQDVASDPGMRDLCQLLEVLLAAATEREARLQAVLDELREKRQRVAALERELKQSTAHVRDLEQRVTGLQRSLAREHAEAATLHQQLEELRNIERSLEARRAGAPQVRSSDGESEQGKSPAGR